MTEELARSPEATLKETIKQEIELHETAISSQSYLQKAIDFFYHPAESSLHDLQKAQRTLEAQARPASSLVRGSGKNADALAQADLEQTIKTDQNNLKKQLETSSMIAAALSSVPLFIRGPWGIGLSLTFAALDNASPRDGFKEQMTDLALGATKGALLNKLGTSTFLIPISVSLERSTLPRV